MYKKCTPCIKDYHYDFVVDTAHMDEDLKHIMHNELNIHNATDSTPLKLQPYWDLETFTTYVKPQHEDWVMEGMAKENMKIVEK